jgi:hypothetical protein
MARKKRFDQYRNMHSSQSTILLLQAHLPAQLFTIVNDTGNVVYHQIVPDGSNKHVKQAIYTVTQQQTSIKTECYYSDKVAFFHLIIFYWLNSLLLTKIWTKHSFQLMVVSTKWLFFKTCSI